MVQLLLAYNNYSDGEVVMPAWLGLGTTSGRSFSFLSPDLQTPTFAAEEHRKHQLYI